jgi:hypothetical protein
MDTAAGTVAGTAAGTVVGTAAGTVMDIAAGTVAGTAAGTALGAVADTLGLAACNPCSLLLSSVLLVYHCAWPVHSLRLKLNIVTK